ncbi:MAG: hypothetical protein KAV41_02985 [Candidatus Pacebacteria bacterium]|nr:hypothetical protein [Candidatus Paceibacterota bacterium]
MKKTTKEKLSYFTDVDTWSSNHGSDDERFFDFIIEAYRNNDYSISMDDYLSVFSNLNNSLEEIARKKYSVYEHGIALLRRFCNQE